MNRRVYMYSSDWLIREKGINMRQTGRGDIYIYIYIYIYIEI